MSMKILASLAAFLGFNASQVTLAAEVQKKPEHAVVIHFQYGSKDLARLFALEDKIEDAVAKAHVGEYDGNEVAVDGSDGFLYLYGPDADKLLQAIEPVLQEVSFMQGAEVKKRYGPAGTGAKEVMFRIETKSP
jgi:hypothetical protein